VGAEAQAEEFLSGPRGADFCRVLGSGSFKQKLFEGLGAQVKLVAVWAVRDRLLDREGALYWKRIVFAGLGLCSQVWAYISKSSLIFESLCSYL
jgi:hypothetical protein